uniref:Trace amine associated receptor 14a n=1 Tax=Sinocyclocheilus rhinocerous TaxID=307959 RepID=A0A673JES3_9TELE
KNLKHYLTCLLKTFSMEFLEYHCLPHWNTSCSLDFHLNYVNVFLSLYISAISVLMVCGNLYCHHLYNDFQAASHTNLLILSLALSDFLVGICVMPVESIRSINSCFYMEKLHCPIFHVIVCSWVSVDRILALSSPFLYSEKISPTLICIATLFNWLFSLFYNFTLLYVNGNFTDVMCSGECLYIVDEVSSLIDLLIVFLMPCTLIIIILYTHVFVIAKRHATAIRALQVHNRTESSKNRVSDKSERKAAILLGILDDSFSNVINSVLILFFPNQSIIYALLYPWFKKSVKIILTLKVLNTDSSLMDVLSLSS